MRLTHVPALDGLRALAVLGVLAFHSEWGWMSGGFLGVSLFFTLSGYLITRILLVEAGRTATIDYRRFLSRRARRLLPAAFAAVGAAIVLTAAFGTPSQQRALPGDVVGTVGYVANWRSVFAADGYAQLFDEPSMLGHTWSLSVEEQLYLLVPGLALLLAQLGRSQRLRATGGILLGLFVVGLLSAGSIDVAYYATHVRALELFAGAALAVAVTGRGVITPTPLLERWAGPLALAAIVLSWTQITVSDPNLFRGIVAVHAALVCVLIWTVTSQRSPLSAVLSAPPLQWLGTRSYGIYLYHWPVFVTFGLLDVDGAWARIGAWAMTFALAELSYQLIEQPIRHGHRLATLPAIRFVVATPVAMVLVAVVVTRGAPVAIDPEVAADRLARITEAAAEPTPAPDTDDSDPTPTSVATPAVEPAAVGPLGKLAIFGDSIAATTGLGIADWALDTGRFTMVPGVAIPGCPLVTAVGQRYLNDTVVEVGAGCEWTTSWVPALEEFSPDVVVIGSGVLDSVDWVADDGTRSSLRDPANQELFRATVGAINAYAVERGISVAWLTIAEQDDAADTGDLNRLLRLEAAESADVHIIEVGPAIDEWTPGEQRTRRPDGSHLTPEAARDITDALIGPALVAIVGR